jgi:hypothetical protein
VWIGGTVRGLSACASRTRLASSAWPDVWARVYYGVAKCTNGGFCFAVRCRLSSGGASTVIDFEIVGNIA